MTQPGVGHGAPAFPRTFETLTASREGGVLFVEILAPPMNLLGPELVRDLVSLIQRGHARAIIYHVEMKHGRGCAAMNMLGPFDRASLRRERGARATSPRRGGPAVGTGPRHTADIQTSSPAIERSPGRVAPIRTR